MSEIQFDDQVDITDVVCPVTFVKAKVALEELDDGEILAVRMNDGEPVQNVPRSIKEEGHQILKLLDNEDGTYTLFVKKVGGVRKWQNESVRIILIQRFCRQKVWPSQIFIPTAVFRANGFHHCLQIWKKHTTMCMWEK